MKKFVGKFQLGLDRIDHDRNRTESSDFSEASTTSRPILSKESPSKRDIYRHRKQRGVNLGSWFSLESWLVPSLFQKARDPKGSELDVVSGMDTAETKVMLEQHWDNFVNDGDLKWMVDHGVNTIRLPIGYFHFLSGHPDENVRALIEDTDYGPYANVYVGAFSRIQRAIERASDHGLGVLIDLHGAPCGQNADGHCGISDGKAALWNSRSAMRKTAKILVAMANEYARHDNVVGLELLNEPKNNNGLQGFYEEVIRMIRSSSQPAASLPLYLGDAWDISHYTGFVGQQASANNFLVDDFHLYKCFTPQDCKTRCEEHAARLRSGKSPHFNDQHGCGELTRTIHSMSQRSGRSLVIGEWSAALNPGSLHHLANEEAQRSAKAKYAYNQWKSYDKLCAGYFFWTLKKEGPPDSGWGFYSAIEQGVLPPHLDPHVGRRNDSAEVEEARLHAQTAACNSHEDYWSRQKGGPYEHWRFAEGFALAWTDSLAFMQTNASNEIGFEGQWLKTRTAAHAADKGQGSKNVWEFEHGFTAGLSAFKSALYRQS